MFDFIEVMKRAEHGEYKKENDFDLKEISIKARKLVKKYGIKFDPDKIVTNDEELADAVFWAGVEMAETVGIYCRSTERVLRFTRDEILSAVANAPKKIEVGEGRDKRTVFSRKICDRRYPVVFGGNVGAPIPEEIFLETTLSYMKETLVDAIDHGSITVVDGMEVRTGNPLEVRATRREVEYLRTAAIRSGRPGIPLIGAESSGTGIGDLAVANPRYLRTTDIHLIPFLSEMKTDYHNLCKVANFVEYGGYNGNLPNPIVGGYAGGACETAIVLVASYLLGVIVNQAHLHLGHPVDIRFTSTTTPECLWVLNITSQACARNTDLIILGDIFATNGAGTKTLLYETIANAIVNTVSGMHLLGVAAVNGKLPNGSGLEVRLMAETGRAVVDCEMSLEEANELVKQLLEKYRHTFKKPEIGLSFERVYDLKTISPKTDWLKMYEEVKEEVSSLGLNL